MLRAERGTRGYKANAAPSVLARWRGGGASGRWYNAMAVAAGIALALTASL